MQCNGIDMEAGCRRYHPIMDDIRGTCSRTRHTDTAKDF